MKQANRPDFEASIADLRAADPVLASSLVPSGITSFYGESLGWPDWLLEGTEYANASRVPPTIRLVDGLRALANLAAHFNEVELGRMMLEWPRFPLEAEALAAPDLGSALEMVIARVNHRNPTFVASLTHEDGMAIAGFEYVPSLGDFRAIYEQCILVWMFLVVRSFLGISSKGRALLAEVAIGRVHSDSAINAAIACRPAPAINKAFVAVPDEALAFVGPDFKPALWAGVLASDQGEEEAEGFDVPAELKPVAALILRSLTGQGRVPQLADVALALECSERTLARRLAEKQTSYRQLVDHVRMGLAERILRDGKTSVREISVRLGYSDDTAFVRSFRRHAGVSPARWRGNATVS